MVAGINIAKIKEHIGYLGHDQLSRYSAIPLFIMTGFLYYQEGPVMGIPAGLTSLALLYWHGKTTSEVAMREQEWKRLDMEDNRRLANYLAVLEREKEEILQMPELAAKPRKLKILDAEIASTKRIIGDNKRFIDDVVSSN